MGRSKLPTGQYIPQCSVVSSEQGSNTSAFGLCVTGDAKLKVSRTSHLLLLIT